MWRPGRPASMRASTDRIVGDTLRVSDRCGPRAAVRPGIASGSARRGLGRHAKPARSGLGPDRPARRAARQKSCSADFKTTARPPSLDEPAPHPMWPSSPCIGRCLRKSIRTAPSRAFLVWTSGPLIRELSDPGARRRPAPRQRSVSRKRCNRQGKTRAASHQRGVTTAPLRLIPWRSVLTFRRSRAARIVSRAQRQR